MSIISTIIELDHCSIKEKQYDCLVLSKGVEDRSYALIGKYHSLFSQARIFVFDSRRNDERMNASDYERYNCIDIILNGNELKDYQTLSVDNSNLGAKLNEQNLSSVKRVAIDISSMNFWEIGDIVYYFINILRVEHFDVYYTEPDVYRHEISDITNYQIDAYPVSVNYHPSYKSTNTNQSDEIFVALLGFQKNCLKLMKDLYEPGDVYSINGFPSFYPKAKDISLVNNKDYLLDVEISHRLSSDARNPFLCFNLLSEISVRNNKKFMTLCPMGSKPMMLGAFIYSIKNAHSSQIVYPYNESIRINSYGIGHTYCFHFEKSYFETNTRSVE